MSFMPKRSASGRRAVQLLICAGSMIGAMGLVSSCASEVPPTITANYGFPIEKNRDIFVVTNDERMKIVESLRTAGLDPKEIRNLTGYTLTVKLGRTRGSNECGPVRNVVYILSSDAGRLLVVKGRGGTGECAQNIFDAMSAKLVSATTQ